jgi:hypothetical protein
VYSPKNKDAKKINETSKITPQTEIPQSETPSVAKKKKIIGAEKGNR